MIFGREGQMKCGLFILPSLFLFTKRKITHTQPEAFLDKAIYAVDTGTCFHHVHFLQHRHHFISVDGRGVSDAQETQNCPLAGNYGEENSGFET